MRRVTKSEEQSFQTAGRPLGRFLFKEYVDAASKCSALKKKCLTTPSGVAIIPSNKSFSSFSIESSELSTTKTSTSERRSRNLDQSAAEAEIVIDLRANRTSLQEETEAQKILPRQVLSPVPGNESPLDVQLSPPWPETNNLIVVAENAKETPTWSTR